MTAPTDRPHTWDGPVLPEDVGPLEHIAHDMRMGRFPARSSVAEFLAERAARDPTPHVRRSPMEHERDDAPLTWPGSVLPPADDGFPGLQAVEGRSILGKHNGVLDDDILDILQRDAGLCGLARRDAMVTPDWPAFREMRRHRDGEDFDAGEPQGRAGE